MSDDPRAPVADRFASGTGGGISVAVPTEMQLRCEATRTFVTRNQGNVLQRAREAKRRAVALCVRGAQARWTARHVRDASKETRAAAVRDRRAWRIVRILVQHGMVEPSAVTRCADAHWTVRGRWFPA